MAEMTVNISYDKKSQEKINRYIKKLEQAHKDAIKEISARTQDKLIENMIKYGVDSAEIFASIDIKTYDTGLEITVGAEQAVFVEFGTGIVGSENPHPNPKKANWIYGNNGWWYPTTQEKQARYPNQPTTIINGQLYAYTKGQKSKPFLYDTWLWTTRASTPIIRKHIRRVKLD